MKITSVLFASAAALVAVSGAQAADAIVAAEPEAIEYVRVCDAFGTGFFYIPGTETCLKISGLVRTQYNFYKDEKKPSDWNTWTRAQLTFDARTETDLGALRSLITLRGQPDNGGRGTGVWVEEAYIQLGGFTAGKVYSYWDNDLSGEADSLSTNALFNSVRYDVTTGAFEAGISIDELDGVDLDGDDYTAGNTEGNNVGIAGNLGFTAGAVTANLIGGYDFDREEGALRLIATADVGPGTLGFAAVWASGANAYYADSEWAIAAEYGVKATDKLKVTLGAQYSDSLLDASTLEFSTVDQWKYAATFDYAITSGLAAKVSLDYTKVDGVDGEFGGFVRLNRSF
jgi:hypothetical protein